MDGEIDFRGTSDNPRAIEAIRINSLFIVIWGKNRKIIKK